MELVVWQVAASGFIVEHGECNTRRTYTRVVSDNKRQRPLIKTPFRRSKYYVQSKNSLDRDIRRLIKLHGNWQMIRGSGFPPNHRTMCSNIQRKSAPLPWLNEWVSAHNGSLVWTDAFKSFQLHPAHVFMPLAIWSEHGSCQSILNSHDLIVDCARGASNLATLSSGFVSSFETGKSSHGHVSLIRVRRALKSDKFLAKRTPNCTR